LQADEFAGVIKLALEIGFGVKHGALPSPNGLSRQLGQSLCVSRR
jgi:hypothetical protein